MGWRARWAGQQEVLALLEGEAPTADAVDDIAGGLLGDGGRGCVDR